MIYWYIRIVVCRLSQLHLSAVSGAPREATRVSTREGGTFFCGLHSLKGPIFVYIAIHASWMQTYIYIYTLYIHIIYTYIYIYTVIHIYNIYIYTNRCIRSILSVYIYLLESRSFHSSLFGKIGSEPYCRWVYVYVYVDVYVFVYVSILLYIHIKYMYIYIHINICIYTRLNDSWDYIYTARVFALVLTSSCRSQIPSFAVPW